MTEPRRTMGIVMEWERSGLSKEAFASQIGVEPAHLEYWLAVDHLRSDDANAGESTSQEDPDEFELQFPSGVVLRASPAFDRQTLRQIIELLAGS